MRNPIRARRERRETELDRLTAFRASRRLAEEDVTVLGEQLGGLHLETLTDALEEEARVDYRDALERYDQAKTVLTTAEDTAALDRVATLVEDARFLEARVVARRDGRELPVRRDPCFFNPQHPPADRDVRWTPPGGVERAVPVCFGCAERLAAGGAPDHRMVRVGDRWVPWHDAGASRSEVARIQAHAIRGDAWASRVHEAEALTQAAARTSVDGRAF